MRQLLFWGLFPFVIPQALRVRRNAPRFARAAGAQKGASGRGNSYHLLAVGDSIIAGVGATQLTDALVGQTANRLAEQLDARVEWIACGAIGATAQRVLDKLVPRLPPTPADFILLSVGVNDITGLRTLRAWRRSLNALLDQLHRHSPDAVIALAGIPPLHGFPLLPQPLRALFGFRGRSFDAAARVLLDQHPYALYLALDFDPDPAKFSEDGYHPSEPSYQEFGRIAAARLAQATQHRGGRLPAQQADCLSTT